MQKFWRYANLGVIGIIWLLAGCQPSRISPTTQQAVSDAQAHLQLIEKLELTEKYPEDYQEARNNFERAQTIIASESNKEKALPPARASLNASQRILKYFYNNTITPLARAAKAEIEKITTEDPDNPLKGYLPKLDNLLTYSEQIESGQEIAALDNVIKDLNEVIEIKRNTAIKPVTLGDVSFDTGKYDLSAEGKRILKESFEQLIAKQKEELNQYLGETITITLTVIGYTDQQKFRQGTQLEKALLQGVEAQVPQQAVARRQFLNQRLSQFRATTVGNYIKDVLSEIDNKIFIEQDASGRGEELPPKVSITYSPDDPVADAKRRICTVYSKIAITP
jgi:flagellar motor protein MotB